MSTLLTERDLFRAPVTVGVVEVLGQRKGRSAEFHAPRLRRRDALRLPLFDALPLALGHKGQDLQNQIGDEGVHQVFALPRVQQGHIEDADVHPLLLSQHPPLLPHLLVVPAQSVDALHAEQVTGAEPPHQPLVRWTLKVLARLLVHVDVVSVQPRLAHGDDLPRLILVRAGYPNVAVLCCHSSLAAFPLIDGNGITKADKTIPPAAISASLLMQPLKRRPSERAREMSHLP